MPLDSAPLVRGPHLPPLPQPIDLPVLLPLALALAATATAQRPQVAPTKLEPGEEVRVDGDLDEAIWQRAAVLGELTQVEPIEGGEPTYPTEVRLAYDRDFFYVGFICHDDPSEVRARQMDRDANIRYDDVAEMWFDTFHDQRFAFWFQITPGGSRGDALLSDSGSSFNKNWDGIWYGRSKVTDRGWQAEIALPFKTLAFEPDQSTWGFNFRRKRVANGESSRWASPKIAYRFWTLSEGGELIGLEGMEQGYAIDVVPYVKASTGRDRGDVDDDFSTAGDAGVDVSWRPTPSSTLRITTNTDFAETEVDELQVNLTRFPLFFPEKRDFFLEDAGVFEFGAPSRRPSLLPFFSRTIGRDEDGGAVTMLGGVKYTGRIGAWNIGILETYIDDFDDVDRKTLGAMRLSRNLGGESSVGMIFTHGRPLDDGSSTTAGVDFRLGSSRFFGDGHSGTLWGWALGTGGEGRGGDGLAYGMRARSKSSTWEHEVQAEAIEEDFLPELGFVRRTGVERYRWESAYTWRTDDPDGLVRTYEWRLEPRYTEDTAGDEDTWTIPLQWFELEFESEDSVSFETRRIFERIEDPFEVGGGVDVSPDDYTMTRHVLELESNERRRVGSEIRYEWGDFFSGDIQRLRLSPIVIPSKYFTFEASWEDIDVSLDEGDFDTQLITANFDVAFDPELSWKNLVQYDTDSDDLALQSRLHKILEPGQDLFIVALLGWNKDDGSISPTTQDFAVKLTYTFRF